MKKFYQKKKSENMDKISWIKDAIKGNFNLLKRHNWAWITAAALLVALPLESVAAYSNAVYNSCFGSIFQFGLCPLQVVIYLPFVVEFCAFLIINRKTSPPSYALSFLASAIISYVFFGLALAATASTTIIDTYLAASTLLTICWIAAYAYELFR
jgi:FtsH-binding integral membrane protein